jgi:hypothetical protein
MCYKRADVCKWWIHYVCESCIIYWSRIHIPNVEPSPASREQTRMELMIDCICKSTQSI